MKKFFLLLPFILLAEIDPFSINVNSTSNPNYLTPTERAILKNKKSIITIKKKLNEIKNKIKLNFAKYDEKIDTLEEKIGGLDSLVLEIGSIEKKVKDLKKETDKYIKLEKRVTNLEKNVSKLYTELKNIKSSIKEIIQIQNDNFIFLRNSIDKILKKIKTSTLTPAEAMKKAKSYFFSNKLDKAKELFEFTLAKNYLPATSSFYLGEIYFKKKNYKKALAYYKKSIEIYPKKTSFTAKLLYHSGIAFLKLNQKQAAKLSFRKLINDFPNSKYAKLAKKELEKLK